MGDFFLFRFVLQLPIQYGSDPNLLVSVGNFPLILLGCGYSLKNGGENP